MAAATLLRNMRPATVRRTFATKAQPLLFGASRPTASATSGRAGNATLSMSVPMETGAAMPLHLSKAQGACENTAIAPVVGVVAVCTAIAGWRMHLNTIPADR